MIGTSLMVDKHGENVRGREQMEVKNTRNATKVAAVFHWLLDFLDLVLSHANV